MKVSTLTEKEALQRANLLASNRDLRQLHEQLVGTNSISDDEFWESRKAMLVSEANRSDKQTKGMPSMLLADVRPTSSNSTTVQYKLTPQAIQQIFAMYPNVQKLYSQLVPDKVTISYLKFEN